MSNRSNQLLESLQSTFQSLHETSQLPQPTFKSILTEEAKDQFAQVTPESFADDCESHSDLIGSVSVNGCHLSWTGAHNDDHLSFVQGYPQYHKYLSESNQFGVSVFGVIVMIKYHMIKRKEVIEGDSQLLEQINGWLRMDDNCPYNTFQQLFDAGMHACIFLS